LPWFLLPSCSGQVVWSYLVSYDRQTRVCYRLQPCNIFCLGGLSPPLLPLSFFLIYYDGSPACSRKKKLRMSTADVLQCITFPWLDTCTMTQPCYYLINEWAKKFVRAFSSQVLVILLPSGLDKCMLLLWDPMLSFFSLFSISFLEYTVSRVSLV